MSILIGITFLVLDNIIFLKPLNPLLKKILPDFVFAKKKLFNFSFGTDKQLFKQQLKQLFSRLGHLILSNVFNWID